MALECAVGSFNTGTGTSDIVISGLGFQPKAIIFFYTGSASATDAVGALDAYCGFGFAADASGGTEQYAGGNFQEDDQPTTDEHSHQRADCCVSQCDPTGYLGRASIKAWQSGGFTLQVDDAFAVDQRVGYIAYGGSDITDVSVGHFQKASGTAPHTQDVDVGFTPDVIICGALNYNGGAPPNINVNTFLSLGAASGTASGEQAHSTLRAQDGAADALTKSYSRSGECFCLSTHVGGAGVNEVGVLNAWLSGATDGFQVNWTVSNATPRFCYLAIKGGNWLVGNLTTRTDTNDIVESGFGFQPSGIFFGSACRAESASETESADGQISMGAASSTSARIAQESWNEDAAAKSNITVAIEHDEVYISASNGALDALMDLKSIESGGFTCVMDDTEPSAGSFVWYVACGSSAAPSSTPFYYYNWRRRALA